MKLSFTAIKDIVVLVLVAAAVWFVYKHHEPPVVHVASPAPDVKVVTVDKPVLTEKVVRQVIKDPADQAMIQALLVQLQAAQADVKTVTVSTIDSADQGGGRIDQVPETASTPQGYHFKDYRLTFDTDLKTARYTLDQHFEAVSGTGRRKDGSPIAYTKLFELGPGTERRELQTVSTTELVADETSPHWLVHLAIQAGLGGARDDKGATTTLGVGAVQWLKHGRTKAAEDVTYAILSPAVVFGNGVQDVGVLPVSLNLGRIPHQPFSNLWISPFISRSRAGGFVTASF